MILPIGNNCVIAQTLKDTNLRKWSYPYDWILCDLKNSIELLLKVLKMPDEEFPGFFKDFFSREGNKTHILQYNNAEIFTNVKYGMSFPHDTIPELYEKYLRRFKRMKDNFYSSKHVLIVFGSRWENNETELLSLYDSLLEIKKDINFLVFNAISNTLLLESKYIDKFIIKYIDYKKEYVANDNWYYDTIYRQEMSRLITDNIDTISKFI
jgi:hypothetical protein